MYYLYNRIEENGKLHLAYEDDISLAGCNIGIIANELSEILQSNVNPPIGWGIPIAEKYNKNDQAVILDIKPKSEEIFLCEIDLVFGYSFPEWTPIMLRLKKLYNDVTKEDLNKEKFIYPNVPEILYTMFYLNGSFHNGEINGTWVSPNIIITINREYCTKCEEFVRFHGFPEDYFHMTHNNSIQSTLSRFSRICGFWFPTRQEFFNPVDGMSSNLP